MTHQHPPEYYAEAAQLAEASHLWNIAEVNWRLAAEATSRTPNGETATVHHLTPHTKENTHV
jgi:hypothetical protein